jgi:hypothetical protein
MQAIAKALRRFLILVSIGILVWGVLSNYSFVFSKVVTGEIMEVERVTQPTAVIGSTMTPEQMFSFAVMIRSESGEIFSASSEDRQWAVAKKGYCVEARFYPYPPWNLEKTGTYFNARLVKVLADCNRAGAPKAQVPPALPTESPPANN